MKELRSMVKSILGILILATAAGWLIEVLTGDWEGSLIYVDIALLAIGISILLPNIVERLEGRVMNSQLFLIVTTIVWIGSILSPFVLIAMLQGRLVMLGILIGVITLLVFFFRMEGARESPSGKVWIYVLLFIFPFAYALLIWFDLRLVASALILLAVNILLYTQSLINYAVSFYRSKENWKPLRFELPIEEPKILYEGVTSIQHLEHLDLGFLETNTCQVELTIDYEVNGLHYSKEGFVYNWYAPFENRLKAFDWETDMKGNWINLIYDPEEPSAILGALGKKEEIEEMIFNYKQKQKKYQLLALGIAVLGLFLFFFIFF